MHKEFTYDFSGYATRNNIQCSDGRTILKDAFKDCDQQIVPLVWNHQHGDVTNVLGHALLENRDDGVYAYCAFNNTEKAQNAKEQVKHGDIEALSIFANHLRQNGGNVIHGAIREVSLVLAGANPGAFIDSVIAHGEYSDEDAVIYPGNSGLVLSHSDEEKTTKQPEKKNDESKSDDESKDETIEDIFNTLTEKQKSAVYTVIGLIGSKYGADTDKEEETNMKHNLFENENNDNDTLAHADTSAIFSDAKRYGSLKDSALAHGIEDIEYLFPDAKTINNVPEFIKREDGWVTDVMNGVHRTPFSRIKSVFANITEDDARAKGYIKGKQKKDEVFSLLKRTTTPTTIYKKQKLDRDDVIDITDFDVVSWIKTEMRMMLNEEIARAILVGDGRLSSSDDKINEQNIRPIWTDADLYTINKSIKVNSSATTANKAKLFITESIRARKDYKGSGAPALYVSEEMLTECLLLEDNNGRLIYDSIDKLKNALRVSKIVTVPVMEGLKRTDSTDNKEHTLAGIFVNLSDYNVGADKGGAINMFDDFDIDYNAQKYLIETRCSGALTKPYSAIAVEFVVDDTAPTNIVG